MNYISRKDIIHNLYFQKGLSFQQIGCFFGLSRQRIYQIVRNIKTPGCPIWKKYKKEYCEFCGGKNNLEVHHLDRNRKNNNCRNLMTLCHNCHCWLHHHFAKKQFCA